MTGGVSSSGHGLRKSLGNLSANGWGSVPTQLVFGLRCPSTSGQRSIVQFAAQMLQGCSPWERLREQVRCSPGMNFPHLATACPAGCDLGPRQRWNGGPGCLPGITQGHTCLSDSWKVLDLWPQLAQSITPLWPGHNLWVTAWFPVPGRTPGIGGGHRHHEDCDLLGRWQE